MAFQSLIMNKNYHSKDDSTQLQTSVEVNEISKSQLLQFSNSSCNITLEEVAELYNDMRKETLLKQYCDTSKIKERKAGKYTQFYILLQGKQYTAKTRKELIDRLFEVFCGDSVMTLEQAYHNWMLWRAEINTPSKTLKENKNEWNRFIKDTPLSKMQVAKIEISDFEKFLYDITMDYAITSKRLTNVISVLNGILRYCVSNKIITHNLLTDVDKQTFHNRCKPQNNKKDNYTAEERQKILDYLQDKTDGYSLAIRFSFYLPLRFSETAAIKYSDIKDGNLNICRAQRTCQKMNDDLTFEPRYLTNDERIKGNKETGFRTVALTPTALSIAELAHQLYPENEYLFMRNNEQILGNTFNEELEKICKKLNIKYRSSHQLRFTIATMLFQAGLPINKLSVLLGHATTATTWIYVRQQAPNAEDLALMESVLD